MERIRFFILVFSLFHATSSSFAQAKIHGAVANADGRRVAGASVLLLHSADSALVKGTVTDSNGDYFFENIAGGEY
jgi:hypothetical protein